MMMQLRSRLAKALRRLTRRIDPDPYRALRIGDELKVGEVTIAVREGTDEEFMRLRIQRELIRAFDTYVGYDTVTAREKMEPGDVISLDTLVGD